MWPLLKNKGHFINGPFNLVLAWKQLWSYISCTLVADFDHMSDAFWSIFGVDSCIHTGGLTLKWFFWNSFNLVLAWKQLWSYISCTCTLVADLDLFVGSYSQFENHCHGQLTVIFCSKGINILMQCFLTWDKLPFWGNLRIKKR